MIALTYDDGPRYSSTRKILRALKQEFVTVDELYRYKRKKLHVAGSYFCVK